MKLLFGKACPFQSLFIFLSFCFHFYYCFCFVLPVLQLASTVKPFGQNDSGAPNENIAQKNLNIALLNVF